MTQYKFPPPRAIETAFQRELGNFLPAGDPDRKAFKKATLVGLEVFALTLPEVANLQVMEQPVGWRVLVMDAEEEGRCLAIAEIEAGKRQPRVVSLSLDENERARFLGEVQNLQDGARLSNGFKLSLLQVPGLLSDAFWLRSARGDADVVIPIPGFETFEQAEYPVAEYLRSLQKVIPQFLGFDSQSKAPSWQGTPKGDEPPEAI